MTKQSTLLLQEKSDIYIRQKKKKKQKKQKVQKEINPV